MAPQKPGRPKGATKHGELAIEKLTLRLTPTAKRWVESNPKGFIPDWIEQQARMKV